MHIASVDQKGIAPIPAPDSRRPVYIDTDAAADQAIGSFRTDDDAAAVLAPWRAGTGPVRLDPARGTTADVWWQSARNAEVSDLVAAHGAARGQMSGETIGAWPNGEGARLQVVAPPNTVQQTFENPPDMPERQPTSAPFARVAPDPMPLLAPAPVAVGWRLRSWLSASGILRRLRLLFVRSGGQTGFGSLVFAPKASIAPAMEPIENNEVLTGYVLLPRIPAEVPVVGSDAVTEDRSLEMPPDAASSWCEAAGVVENAKTSISAQTREALSNTGDANTAPNRAKAELGFVDGVPVFLFTGEMCYASGIDILADAMVTVCQSDQDAQFVFVGNGPMKNDLETQISLAGFAHRCRFTGGLSPAEFETLLTACDFVVIPAREGQDGGLATRALSLAKPVLTTHQAQIRGVVHGQNGLVVYDCANSLVWGLRELIARPLRLQRESDERQVP